MKWFQKLLNTYNKGLAYEGLFKEFEKLLKIISTERAQFTACINDLETENILLHADLTGMQNKAPYEPNKPLFNLENTLEVFEKKTHSKPFKYAFKGDGKDYDIKFSLLVEDKDIISLYGDKITDIYDPKTPTECVEAVSKYFIYKLKPKYVSDQKLFHKRDLWERADIFLKNLRGDCDGTAIAMHKLIEYILYKKDFKEHYKRLWLHINDNYLESHANNLWLADDGYFYTVESTIDPKGTFNKKWLHTPLAFDSFYTHTRGIANSLLGSRIGNGEVDSQFIKEKQ